MHDIFICWYILHRLRLSHCHYASLPANYGRSLVCLLLLVTARWQKAFCCRLEFQDSFSTFAGGYGRAPTGAGLFLDEMAPCVSVKKNTQTARGGGSEQISVKAITNQLSEHQHTRCRVFQEV